MKAAGAPQLPSMLSGDGGVRRQARNADASAANTAELGGLDGQRLAHDGAAVGKQLQLGHGAAARGGRLGRRGTGRGRQGAQGGGRGLLQKGTHGLGLPQNSVHGGRLFLGGDGRRFGLLLVCTIKEYGKQEEGGRGERDVEGDGRNFEKDEVEIIRPRAKDRGGGEYLHACHFPVFLVCTTL